MIHAENIVYVYAYGYVYAYAYVCVHVYAYAYLDRKGVRTVSVVNDAWTLPRARPVLPLEYLLGVWGLGFSVWGFECTVSGLGFRV